MGIKCTESRTQKTLSLKDYDTYVQENDMLSRERASVFTQVSTDPKCEMLPGFVFKGKGVRASVSPPENMIAQWAEKCSYRLEQMIKTIEHLPNRHHIFSQKNYAIYVLDDYAVHLMPELRSALLERGHI